MLRCGLELLSYLGDARRTRELHRQPLDRARHGRVQFLERARDADGPTLVAEVALDLAHDVGRRVGRKRYVARQLEAVDRLDQADRAHLLDVLQGLAATGVTARERSDERQ